MAALALLASSLSLPAHAADTYTTTHVTDGRTNFVVVENPGGGATISYAAASGVGIIEEVDDGNTLAFKDSNSNGRLDVWEDWRLGYNTRAEALAQEVTIDQIAGLMLFSSHERNPDGVLTDAQRNYLQNNDLRNVLNAGPNHVAANVMWSNEMQAFVEGLVTEDKPYIPVNFSSDPRSTAGVAQYDSAGPISRWPSHLGLAAIFDTDVIHDFARISSEEYRALGITTALGPQIDTATEPRWLRVDGTFGENTDQASAAAAAYVHGSQNSFNAAGEAAGWGRDSINTMIKHVPGDGAGEGGRESHTNAGKYNVFPGDNFEGHLAPFVAGIDSMSMMSKYSISIDADGEPMFGQRVGAAYNKDLIDVVRVEHGYDGVICTDWGVTSRMAHGMEGVSTEERHYRIIAAGLDMFGGNNNKAPVLAAYDLWQADYEAGLQDIDAETRFRQSGERILRMFFAPGLYDHPYLDLVESRSTVASADKVAAGYQAQLDSVVMLKNDGVIKETDASYWSDKTAYIPASIAHGFPGLFGDTPPPTTGPTMDIATAEQYFGRVVTDTVIKDDAGNPVDLQQPDLSDVDIVVAGLRSPMNGTNFSGAGLRGDGTFYPLSLQYRPYTADGPNVRRVSIAGDILPDGSRQNRSYFGETSYIANEQDLDSLLDAVTKLDELGRDVPVMVAIKAVNPVVPAEFEEQADGIVVGFSVSDEALFDVILGQHNPQGRLPIAFPRDMDAVEAQMEDVGQDTEPYVDAAGNAYGYGFGLRWAADATAVGIAVTSPPSIAAYTAGDPLDLTGMVVTVTYSDGTTAVVPHDELTVTGYNPNVLGRQTVTVATTIDGTVHRTQFTVTVGPRPTPPPGMTLQAPYEVPGFHNISDRRWYTACEPYSQTFRCRTDIWATVVEYKDGRFVATTGWHFNNLTYLPFMTEDEWGANPLANDGAFTSGDRQWRTECHTAATGTGACRSYIFVKNVVHSRQAADGAWSYYLEDAWLFNNLVRFRR
ncbi:glycoside hydrolase family 3 N-terminal domain-containing protein [Tessaracoccus massiliensis]|uniref:glycoside hydrolase family 3 N-terminal domain-containing protein n=1 Tax=Tessaracoccus massiliensis TaxID=1522311 RepID=UPI000694129F|nr:glycoside hydrolase family 3 N-terminal domain-containing protein [Tessaracoccus massiliensis]